MEELPGDSGEVVILLASWELNCLIAGCCCLLEVLAYSLNRMRYMQGIPEAAVQEQAMLVLRAMDTNSDNKVCSCRHENARVHA